VCDDTISTLDINQANNFFVQQRENEFKIKLSPSHPNVDLIFKAAFHREHMSYQSVNPLASNEVALCVDFFVSILGWMKPPHRGNVNSFGLKPSPSLSCLESRSMAYC
jgi:hypothetical protein